MMSIPVLEGPLYGYDGLAAIGRMVNDSLPLPEKLEALARMVARVVGADLCLILSVDSGGGHLSLRAASLPLDESVWQPFVVDRSIREALARCGSGEQWLERVILGAYPLLNLPRFCSLLCAPLVIGAEFIGLLHCYFAAAITSPHERRALLTVAANQVAMAMHADSLLGRVTQRAPTEALFDALRYQATGDEQAASAIQLARSLGGDLKRVHTVVLVEVESIGEPRAAPGIDALRGELAQRGRIRNRLRQRLLDLYPGSLFSERAGLLVCLLCLARDPKGIHLKDRLGALARQTLAGEACQLFIGLGNPCLQLTDYPRGFAQAEEALLLGRRLHPEGEITSFDDLGLFRYLYRIARMDTLGDRHQELVGRIAAYDRRRRAELLDTLEAYLENSGNLTRTSALLFVHRNTLIQRLERLQMDFDLDLEERPNWLALLFAIKVYKLRQELQRQDQPIEAAEGSAVE